MHQSPFFKNLPGAAFLVPRRYIRGLTLVILLVSITRFSTAAQVVLKANDPAIAYSLIGPIHYFARVTVFDTSGNVQMEFVNENKRTVDTVRHTILFARSRSIPFGKTYMDSSVTRWDGPFTLFETSAPLTRHLSVTFGKREVKAHGLADGKSTDSLTQMEEGYFDDNIIEDLFGYLPIQKDIRYHLNCYRYESKGGKNPYEIHFAFEDVLQNAFGNFIHCNVLYFENTYQHGYCWIEPTSRRNLKEIIYERNHIVLIQVI